MVKSEGESPEQTGGAQDAFERRLRRTRLRMGIALPIAAGSLAVAHFVQPMPLPYLLAMFGLGIALGILMIVSSGIANIWSGILFGVVMGLLIPYIEEQFLSGVDGGFFAGFWPGMSALCCGMTLIMIPLLRVLVRRTMPRVREQQAAVSAYRLAGDSQFVALCRHSAVKMGKGFIIAFIVMGCVLAGLAMFVWVAEGSGFGLLMLAMMLVSIGFLVWMLLLVESGGTSSTST